MHISLFHYNNMDEFLRLKMNAGVSLALSPNSVETSQKVFLVESIHKGIESIRVLF